MISSRARFSFVPLSSLALTVALASFTSHASAALPSPDPDNGGLTLPAGFRAIAVADNVGAARFVVVGENGDIYAKLADGGIVALRDTNGDGRAEVKETFGEGGGTGIALRNGWLYYSTNSAVLRYKLTAGELVPKGAPETIVSNLPDRRQHSAKSFAFGPDGKLYVEIGSPSNALGVPDRQQGAVGSTPEQVQEFLSKHGGIWRFDADKPNQTPADGFHFTTGHRHMIALAWQPVSKSLFGVMHGRDQLNGIAPNFYTAKDNAERVSEEMHLMREGVNLGWPYTYYDPLLKARMVAPEYGGDNKKRAEAGKYDEPVIAFPGHWAPLQMAFYNAQQFPAKYRGGAFIAFHGSWNRAPEPQRGYNITFAPFDAKGMPAGTHEVFANGFAGKDEIAAPREAKYRPSGVAVGPDGSIYVTCDQGGRLWRIFYAGE